MINMLLIQLIGAIGYSLIALSYFKKKKKDILFFEIIAYIFFVIHYYLLNGISGAICNLVGLFALVVLFLFDKYKLNNKFLAAMFFVLILLVINILTFQNIYSIFPLVASVIIILSFLFNKENHIRIIGIISAVCWLIYAIVYKSYVAIIFEVIILVNVCLSLYKNINHKK